MKSSRAIEVSLYHQYAMTGNEEAEYAWQFYQLVKRFVDLRTVNSVVERIGLNPSCFVAPIGHTTR